MKVNCPKCSAQADKENESINCTYCGYSTDDFVITRSRFARVSEAPPDITRTLPSRKVNGSRREP